MRQGSSTGVPRVKRCERRTLGGATSDPDDGAGDGAGDALDLLDVADDHAAQVVHGGRFGAGDHVVGTGHALGHDDALDGVDLLGHLSRLADVGLDQDVRVDGHGTPYIGLVAKSPKIEQFKDMARQAQRDLFDQSHPIGRLSLVQCAMLGGGTVVTISLAGSLFFSISPTAADHKVLLYLLFTIAPFAIVSPLLGPLIDRSRGARRLMVVASAIGQAVLCPLMATHLHSLLLFPLAFLVLVCQKLYLVTKGALVPEMAALTGPDEEGEQAGYATLNARLTLLGTVAGFVVSIPAVILYKLGGSPAVLVFATLIFVGAIVAGARLPVFSGAQGGAALDRRVHARARVRAGGRGDGPRAGPVEAAADRQPRGDARPDRHVHRARPDRVHDVHARLRAAAHARRRSLLVRAGAGGDGRRAPSWAWSWSGGCANA